jgi:hypothetical protein
MRKVEMSRLPSPMQKAAEIILRDGLTSLFVRIIKSRYFRISDRVNSFLYRQVIGQMDRIAARNIPNSRKFTLIYKKQLWLKAVPHLNPDKSLSGHGSTLASTRVLRGELEHFLREHNTQKFFDAPCGDFNWMKHVKLPDDCDYLGGDIVPRLIANLQKDCKGPRRQFINFDLIVDVFPSADVWLCRDCLQHLSHSDIILVLNNFRRSEVKHALILNYVGVKQNIDINTGGFRFVDLTLPPFDLPPPRQKLSDVCADGVPRYIGVWRREDMRPIP